MCTRVLRRPKVFLRVRCNILILLIKTLRCSICSLQHTPLYLIRRIVLSRLQNVPRISFAPGGFLHLYSICNFARTRQKCGAGDLNSTRYTSLFGDHARTHTSFYVQDLELHGWTLARSITLKGNHISLRRHVLIPKDSTLFLYSERYDRSANRTSPSSSEAQHECIFTSTFPYASIVNE